MKAKDTDNANREASRFASNYFVARRRIKEWNSLSSDLHLCKACLIAACLLEC